MTEYFKSLAEGDYKKLIQAVSEITILIAGADGEIDQDELQWAEKLTHIRSYKMSNDLIGFYQEVGKTFHEDIENLIKELPSQTAERQALLSKRLEEVNPILGKLDHLVALHLYKSYTSFAKHVAKASGGVLGFFSIGPNESDLIKLPMITPIIAQEGEEEE